MFRKYLYEIIEDDRYKEAELCKEFEEWSEESNMVAKAAFTAGFDAALDWIEEIIMKRTTEQKLQNEHRR